MLSSWAMIAAVSVWVELAVDVMGERQQDDEVLLFYAIPLTNS